MPFQLVIAFSLIFFIGVMGQPTMLAKIYPVKTHKDLMVAGVLGGTTYGLCSVVWILVGHGAMGHEIPHEKQIIYGRFPQVVVMILCIGFGYWGGWAVAILGTIGWGFFASVTIPTFAMGLQLLCVISHFHDGKHRCREGAHDYPDGPRGPDCPSSHQAYKACVIRCRRRRATLGCLPRLHKEVLLLFGLDQRGFLAGPSENRPCPGGQRGSEEGGSLSLIAGSWFACRRRGNPGKEPNWGGFAPIDLSSVGAGRGEEICAELP